MEATFNHYLRPSEKCAASNFGGKGYIETPGEGENIRWQNRNAAPTDYEQRLADALEQIFEAGFEDGGANSQAISEKLNAKGVKTPEGESWTPDNLVGVMARLGQ